VIRRYMASSSGNALGKQFKFSVGFCTRVPVDGYLCLMEDWITLDEEYSQLQIQ
jgi:hypothetical protein